MAAQHLTNCTAQYFAMTWRKYDADGNGYIEDKELKNFLADLANEEKAPDVEKFTRTFMSKYDKNKDGKIDMKELAAVLKPEENFLLLVRSSSHGSPNSVEFTKIWKQYDVDKSGFIESSELKNFLKDAYASCGQPLSEAKLQEYSQSVLELYDKDDNHKLDFNEMIKLLPLATNYLVNLQFDKLTEADLKPIFAHYDRNNDMSIAEEELHQLLGDLLQKDGKEANPDTISSLKQSVMQHCDKNKDGKIQYSELALVLNFKA